MKDWIQSRLIYKVITGSHAYGTSNENSDMDFRGVCIPPANYLLGLENFEQHETTSPDETIFALKKFVNLARKNNPNIIELLFIKEDNIIYINEFGQELVDLRYDFLSKQAFKTFGGYAFHQLKKMTHVDKTTDSRRAESFRKFGYDTKNAMHLIRLLRMGIEILTLGEVIVSQPDYKELLEIRQGRYTLDEIKEQANILDEKLKIAYEKSTLQDVADYNKISNWLLDIHKRSLSWKE